MLIEKGTINDIDELEILYDDLNDYLESHVNHAGWIKGIYPIRKTAIEGIDEDNLFVLRREGVIAGSVILNHVPEKAYEEVIWAVDAAYKDIIVIHTLVVHPHFMEKGIASQLMDFAKEYSITHSFKSIRLDVSIDNKPAIKLYEKCGYKYVGTVDLGLNYPPLKWFKLYELIL